MSASVPASKPAEKSRPLDLYTLSWPIFVEMALATLIGTFCLWMAGSVSAAAVAVFGMSNQLRMMFDRLFRVVSMGTSVLVTQHRGGGDAEGARALARAGFSASLWMGVVAMLLVGAWPDLILRVLYLPPELMDMAVPYMRVIGLALMIESANITMLAVLRAFTHTRDSMRMATAMYVLQAVVSLPLVFGVGPLPAQGVMGLAWGHLISRGLVFGMLVSMWAVRLDVALRWRDLVRVAGEPFRAILHIGLPSAGEKIGYRLCFLATVAMAGSLGTVALAVHAYAMQIGGLVNMVVNALGSGAEVIVGHHVGAGKLRTANKLMMRAVRISLLATGVGAVLAWLVMPHAIALFSDDPAVPVLLATILAIEIVMGQGRVFNIVVIGGLRAAGDVHFPVKASILINVLAGTVLAWVLGIHFGLGLVGIWLAYTADECLRGIAMMVRWHWRGWTPLARMARRRVLAKRRLQAALQVA